VSSCSISRIARVAAQMNPTVSPTLCTCCNHCLLWRWIQADLIVTATFSQTLDDARRHMPSRGAAALLSTCLHTRITPPDHQVAARPARPHCEARQGVNAQQIKVADAAHGPCLATAQILPCLHKNVCAFAQLLCFRACACFVLGAGRGGSDLIAWGTTCMGSHTRYPLSTSTPFCTAVVTPLFGGDCILQQ
jgi:hypothetical protein